MKKACCVPTCNSEKNVPGYLFPKNSERRKLWLQSLQMQPIEHEIQKLQVCYKHFRDDDISCTRTRRVLKSTAIPSIRISSTNENTTTVNTNTVSNLVQYKHNEQIQDKQLESHLPKQEELILQDQDNKYVEQTEKPQHEKQDIHQIRKRQQEVVRNLETTTKQCMGWLLNFIEEQQQTLRKYSKELQEQKEQMLYPTEEQQQYVRELENKLQHNKETMLYVTEVVRSTYDKLNKVKDAVESIYRVVKYPIPNPDLRKN